LFGLRVTALFQKVLLTAAACAACAAPAAVADTGGASMPTEPTPTTPTPKARVASDGTALAPESAPEAVKKAIWAANRIIDKPYVYGGGHRRWEDRGYDCSGAVSYALHGAELIDSPGDAVVLGRLDIMERGKGRWMTYYWNHSHGYIVIAGLRFDTSGPGERGPRWRRTKRSSAGFYARHPQGL
jgi:hypothetical protein